MPRGGIAPMLPTPAVVVVSPRSLRTLLLIGISYLRYAIHDQLVPQLFKFVNGNALAGHSKGVCIDRMRQSIGTVEVLGGIKT